jgi:hypothetical protein
VRGASVPLENFTGPATPRTIPVAPAACADAGRDAGSPAAMSTPAPHSAARREKSSFICILPPRRLSAPLRQGSMAAAGSPVE